MTFTWPSVTFAFTIVHVRDIHLYKCTYPWPSSLQVYISVTYTFTGVHIRDLHLYRCTYPWPSPLRWTKDKCLYAKRKPTYDFISDDGIMFSVPVFISRTISVGMCATLTSTVRVGLSQILISDKVKPIYDFPFDGTGNLQAVHPHAHGPYWFLLLLLLLL